MADLSDVDLRLDPKYAPGDEAFRFSAIATGEAVTGFVDESATSIWWSYDAITNSDGLLNVKGRLRGKFYNAGSEASALFAIAVDDYGEVYINNAYMGTASWGTGYGTYTTYNFTLKAGLNVFEIRAWNVGTKRRCACAIRDASNTSTLFKSSTDRAQWRTDIDGVNHTKMYDLVTKASKAIGTPSVMFTPVKHATNNQMVMTEGGTRNCQTTVYLRNRWEDAARIDMYFEFGVFSNNVATLMYFLGSSDPYPTSTDTKGGIAVLVSSSNTGTIEIRVLDRNSQTVGTPYVHTTSVGTWFYFKLSYQRNASASTFVVQCTSIVGGTTVNPNLSWTIAPTSSVFYDSAKPSGAWFDTYTGFSTIIGSTAAINSTFARYWAAAAAMPQLARLGPFVYPATDVDESSSSGARYMWASDAVDERSASELFLGGPRCRFASSVTTSSSSSGTLAMTSVATTASVHLNGAAIRTARLGDGDTSTAMTVPEGTSIVLATAANAQSSGGGIRVSIDVSGSSILKSGATWLTDTRFLLRNNSFATYLQRSEISNAADGAWVPFTPSVSSNELVLLNSPGAKVRNIAYMDVPVHMCPAFTMFWELFIGAGSTCAVRTFFGAPGVSAIPTDALQVTVSTDTSYAPLGTMVRTHDGTNNSLTSSYSTTGTWTPHQLVYCRTSGNGTLKLSVGTSTYSHAYGNLADMVRTGGRFLGFAVEGTGTVKLRRCTLMTKSQTHVSVDIASTAFQSAPSTYATTLTADVAENAALLQLVRAGLVTCVYDPFTSGAHFAVTAHAVDSVLYTSPLDTALVNTSLRTGFMTLACYVGDTDGTVTINYLVVGGGGGGGTHAGSGGGGGGVLAGSVSVPRTRVVSVTVGVGGTGASLYQGMGTSGGNSTISGKFLSTVTALGGGGGASRDAAQFALSGGSGAGGAAKSTYATGASGTAGQGYAGGNGLEVTAGSVFNSAGGGGGGGGAQGFAASSGIGGSGGAGFASTITGATAYYGGGGGGGVLDYVTKTGSSSSTGGSGGAGGGGSGNGGKIPKSQINGVANTGGGGGGGGYATDAGYSAPAGNGGTGVVIVAIPTSSFSGIYSGNVTTATAGANTVLTFTGAGTFVC
jgi:hypothetical protein